MKPTQDYIFVRPVKRRQSETIEVISGEKYTQGTVIATGPGKYDKKGRLRPLTVKAGDFITYGDLNRGYDFYPKFTKDGVEYRILQEADVCFIADPEALEHGLPDVEIARMVEAGRVLDLTPIPSESRMVYDPRTDQMVAA